MNQNEREGQSSGRTTGATGNQAEQQHRTIEGQESEPGKVWQEGDNQQPTGQSNVSMGNTSVGGSDPRGGQDTGDAGIRGGFDETKPDEVNEQIDETQWQGNRFAQGGFGNQGGGGSNG